MSNHPTPFKRALQHVLDSEIPTDVLSRTVTISLAPSTTSRHYKLYTGLLASFLAMTIDHRIGSKDGSVFLPGTLEGPGRNEHNAGLKTAVVLDADEETSIEHVRHRLEQLGWVYSLYTSHSDGKTVTAVRVADLVLKVGLSHESAISSYLLRQYLCECKGYDAAICSTLERLRVGSDKTGNRVVQIEHGPIRKFRVVIPLEEPFDPSRHYSLTEAKRSWAGYVEAVALALELKFDRACVDLSRVFFLPRHPRGRPFEVHVGGRRLLDLAEIEPAERQEEGRRPAAARASCPIPISPIGDADSRPWLRDYLHRKGRRLDIVGWLTDEIGWETRGTPTDVKAAILCPNDAAHSNPGDLDDTACVAMNPEATAYGRAVITCRHAHCQHLRTSDFLDMILDQIDTQGVDA